MLGRTNAGDGGIFLNATIEPKEVVQGQTISAGDFVEYYRNEAKTQINTSNMSVGSHFEHIRGELFFWFDYGTTLLIKFVKIHLGEIQTIETINSDTIFSKHIMIANDRILLCTGKNLKLYSLGTDSITLLDSHTLQLSSEAMSYNGVAFTKLNDTEYIVLTSRYVNTASQRVNSWGRIIVSNDTISVTYKTKTSTSILTLGNIIWDGMYLDTNKILIVSGVNGSNTYTGHATVVNVGTDSISKTDIKNLSPNGYYSSQRIFMLPKEYNGMFISPTWYTSTFRNFEMDVYKSAQGEATPIQTVQLFNIIKEAYQGEDIYDTIGDGMALKSSASLSIARENVIYMAFYPLEIDALNNVKTKNTAIVRLEFDPVGMTITPSNCVKFEVSDIKYVSNDCTYHTGEAYFAEDDNGNVTCIFNTSTNASDETYGTYKLNLSYKDGILGIAEDTNYVQRYEGNNPIGVAKDSGESGDTINVYVPSSTY